MAHCVYGHFLHPLYFFSSLRFLERHAVCCFFLGGFNSGLLNAASGIDGTLFLLFTSMDTLLVFASGDHLTYPERLRYILYTIR
jgi:hypothetical protein